MTTKQHEARQRRDETVAKMKAKIKDQDTDIILECLTQIGGGQVIEEKSMIRAYMLGELDARHGIEYTDKVCDVLGM